MTSNQKHNNATSISFDWIMHKMEILIVISFLYSSWTLLIWIGLFLKMK